MSRPSYPFDVRSADVWRIALPATLAFITEPLAGLVDITVIGRLGDVALLGGLVLGALAFSFIFGLTAFLRMGTAGLTAQAVGAREVGDGLSHFLRAALLGVVIGLAMIALTLPIEALGKVVLAADGALFAPYSDYLRVRLLSAPFVLVNYALLGWFYGRAAATTGMLLQMLVHGGNMIFSVIFVYGFGWGVPGVAAGTVLAEVIAAVTGLALVLRHFGSFRRIIELTRWEALRDATELRRLFGLSRDLMIRSAALMTAFGWFTAQTARLGEVPLAANELLMHFSMINAFFLDGQAQAAEQLCGKAVGANYRPAFLRAVRLSMLWGLVIGFGLFIFWLVAGPFLLDFMTTSEPVRAEARIYLFVAALSAFTGVVPFVMDGVMTGATLNTIIRNGMMASLAVFLVAAISLQALLGVTGLWIAIHIFFLTRGLIFALAVRSKLPALFPA